MFGCLKGRVTEQGVDGRQAGVAGGDRVGPFAFQMLEEGPDQRGVQIGDVELGRLDAGAAPNGGQQQPAGVPVGGDCVRAGPALAQQLVGEERLQDRGERAHDRCPNACSRRPAASARSSGTACRYQYVDFGSMWPSQVDNNGRRACTSPPSRYQSSKLGMVKEWRRSCSRGRRRPIGAWMPAASTSSAQVLVMLCGSSRVPRGGTKKLGAAGAGQERARRGLGG